MQGTQQGKLVQLLASQGCVRGREFVESALGKDLWRSSVDPERTITHTFFGLSKQVPLKLDIFLNKCEENCPPIYL